MWTNELGPRHDHLHKHMIVNIDYVPQDELSDACKRFGLGKIVDIRACTSKEAAASYLSPYITKQAAQKWARSVRRVQCSRGLKEHFASAKEWFVESTLVRWERVNPISYEIRNDAEGYKLATINRLFEDAYLEEDAVYREPDLFIKHQQTEAWLRT